MFSKLKKIIIGQPLKSSQIQHEKLSVFRGLPILSSDAISSVAYACEEILWVLIPVVGLAAYTSLLYVTLSIILLLSILIFSYRQTINSYPKGGGSYIVSKENLGEIPSLVAGSALTIDYILTVAVSSCAGSAAIVSAFPALLPHRVFISVLIILLMTLGNLRGISDSSKIFSIPTYFFIFVTIIMIIVGIVKHIFFGYSPVSVVGIPAVYGDLTILLFLKSFSAGCTALTGIEAVSDGVANFKEPATKNAKIVLGLLFLIVIVIFGGVSYLSTIYHAVPSLDKTVLSQIAEMVFGTNTLMFYVIQIATTLILIMAANTAFSDFPLLISFIARDGYAPRQLTKRGDRLSYSNGILALAFCSSLLVIIFNGESHFLLPLYAVGVFMSFTLSQTGMVMKWIRGKEKGWRHKAFINGFGATITFVCTIVIGINKFLHGAWMVFILIPLIIFLMKKIKYHYTFTANELSMQGQEFPKLNEATVKHFIVPVGDLNRSVIKTLNYAKCLSNDIVVFHVSTNDKETEYIKNKWEKYEIDVPLVIEKSDYRDILDPLERFIKNQNYSKHDIITIVLSELNTEKFYDNVLHNHTSDIIRKNLLKNKNIAVITVPYII